MEQEPIKVEIVQPKKKPGKSPFVVSIIFSVLAFIFVALATIFRIAVFKSFDVEVENAGEAIGAVFAAGFLGIIVVVFTFAIDLVGIIFSIVGFSTGTSYFKKIKNPASITMFIISLILFLYSIAFIPLSLFVF